MKIAVLGPCTPEVFREDLYPVEGAVPEGLVGTPINGLVRGLLDLGHDVHLITASPDISEPWRHAGPHLQLSVVPYRPRPRHRALDLFRHERKQMAEELAKSRAEVVSAHWSYEFGWVGVSSGRPCVLTVHDAPLTILRSLPDAYRLLRTIMAYRVRMRAKHVTAVSPYLAKKWSRQMLYSPLTAIIPNVTPALAPADPCLKRKDVVLEIGDESPRKNIKLLIRAFQLFRCEFPAFELRLAGAGLSEDGPLAMWARHEGLASNVQFLGRQSRSQIAAHLAEASIFCHAALEESQPMCLLEAMSANVPIIAGAKAGGVSWTLDEGAAGLLVDVTEPQAIAEGLRTLHTDKALQNRLVARSRELLSQRHTSEAVAQAYVEELQLALRIEDNFRA